MLKVRVYPAFAVLILRSAKLATPSSPVRNSATVPAAKLPPFKVTTTRMSATPLSKRSKTLIAGAGVRAAPAVPVGGCCTIPKRVGAPPITAN